MEKIDEFLVDVDEVLGDWQTPCLEIAEKVSGRRIDITKVDTWDVLEVLTKEEAEAVLQAMAEPGFAYNMRPTPGSQDFIRELKKLGKVRIVTAHFFDSPTWTYDRTHWLHEHFDIRPEHVTFTHEKHSYQGLMLLDDKPSHVEGWKKRHPYGLPILWHTPNTAKYQFDGLRAYTWDQVLTAVEEHIRKVT